jgi:hypothetical protein
MQWIDAPTADTLADTMPTQPSIFVATPCYGGQLFSNYVNAILALQRACIDRGIGLEVEMPGGDALISRARGRIASHFLEETDHSHLLFIDADLGFLPEQVFRLLAADRDLVGGVYPAKHIHWDKVRRAVTAGVPDIFAASLSYVVRFLPSETNSVEVDDQGFGEVAYVGTGFMMVKRAALRRLTDAHPELRARHRDMVGRSQSPDATMLFETMIEPETGQYLSEDYAFCRRWRDIGGAIYADFNGRFTHVGHTTYAGGLQQALIPGGA